MHKYIECFIYSFSLNKYVNNEENQFNQIFDKSEYIMGILKKEKSGRDFRYKEFLMGTLLLISLYDGDKFNLKRCKLSKLDTTLKVWKLIKKRDSYLKKNYITERKK
eukprot:TRINITY_DN6576_c0_g1_i1.p1 TRINITY_DN6576_c0_g1~~TRINITY_DN6576_c0_g1_i1.p1  ORF type:complete len:107 (-),score=18.85 TRINITY_DN6576_c0_g1_i1:232-552(-)